MASPAGFEPTAPGLGILCSILLSYGHMLQNHHLGTYVLLWALRSKSDAASVRANQVPLGNLLTNLGPSIMGFHLISEIGRRLEICLDRFDREWQSRRFSQAA